MTDTVVLIINADRQDDLVVLSSIPKFKAPNFQLRLLIIGKKTLYKVTITGSLANMRTLTGNRSYFG